MAKIRSAPLSIMSCITASDSAVSGTFSACSTVRSVNADLTASLPAYAAWLYPKSSFGPTKMKPTVSTSPVLTGAAVGAGALGRSRIGGGGIGGCTGVTVCVVVGAARSGHQGQCEQGRDHGGSVYVG